MTRRQLALSAAAAGLGLAVAVLSAAGQTDLALAGAGLLLAGLSVLMIDVRRRQGDMARRLKLLVQRQKADSGQLRGLRQLPAELKSASRQSFADADQALATAVGRVEAAGEGVMAGIAQERLAAAERHVEVRRRFDDVRQRFDQVDTGVAAARQDVAESKEGVVSKLGELDGETARRLAAIRDRMVRLDYEPVRQVQALLQLLERVEPRAPLPPAGGWAVDPSTLLRLVELVVSTRPKLVVECGSGTSTVWLGYAVEAAGSGRVVSLEHDERFARRTQRLLAEHGLDDIAEVRLAPLTELKLGDDVFVWYERDAVDDLDGVGLLLVDGPPKASGERARYPALPVLAPKLADGAWIVFDDADRAEEREAMDAWLAEYPDLRRDDEDGNRCAVLVYRPPA